MPEVHKLRAKSAKAAAACSWEDETQPCCQPMHIHGLAQSIPVGWNLPLLITQCPLKAYCSSAARKQQGHNTVSDIEAALSRLAGGLHVWAS
jgi:hypothetical protein